MAATRSSDFLFEPKVWSDHAMAYFDQRLVYGAFALKNTELQREGTGIVINFPYYKSIGKASKVAEDESVTVDNLTDDSFTATIFEVAKAVGFKKRSFMESADKMSNIMMEAQRQLGRRHAEFVDQELNDEITSYSGGAAIGNVNANYDNLTIGFKATAATDVMNIRNLHTAKTIAFGDKAEAAIVCFMHSLQWLDSRIDSVAGFMRADANAPYSAINGFVGQLAGMAIVVTDSVKKLPTQIANKDAYLAHFHKVNSYGIIMKQEMEFEQDKDIKARQIEIVSNQWYGVKSFDRKISADDTKAGGLLTTVSK